LHIPVLAAAQLWTGSTLQGDTSLKVTLLILVILLAALAYRVIEQPAMWIGSASAIPALARTSP
jgi:peptidoglycan/LPS O-acetylase OafA/YrhL